MSSKKDRARLIDTLEKITIHDHLCLFYENQEEQIAAVIPFIRIGLERGEKCIYISDDNSTGNVFSAIRSEGINVDSYVASGALTQTDKQDSYLKMGCFDPDWMIEYLKQTVSAAQKDGFRALRIAGEMTWALGGNPGAEKLIEYEAKFNRFSPDFDCVLICLYDRHKVSPEVILDIIQTHPLVIYGSQVCRNFYYVPPDDFSALEHPETKVERMLCNIQEHEKARE